MSDEVEEVVKINKRDNMLMNLKRSDKQYLEIEQFEDYELTQCIVYEMAIRDNYYKNLVKEIIECYKQNQEAIDNYIDIRKKEDISSLEVWEHIINNEIQFKILTGLINKMNGIVDIYLDYILPLSDQYQDTRLGNEFWKIVDILSQVYQVNEDILDQEKGILIHQKDIGTIELNREIKRDGYLINSRLYVNDDYCYNPNKNNNEENEVKNIKDFSDFVKNESRSFMYDNDGSFGTDIEIISKFKRPLLKIDRLRTVETKLTLNLNRPLNEIIAYIKHIKNDIDDNNLIQLPIELLGEELQRADNLVCNDKGKCFDPRSILSKQQKMADMFYIYDCIEKGYTQQKIRNEVFNYYADKNMNVSLDFNTLRKYSNIAKEYIYSQKYKEMLTGINIQELEKDFSNM